MGPGMMARGYGMGPGAMTGWSGTGMGPGAMNQGTGNGWSGTMGPGAMHSGTGGGWMSWMGNMFGAGRTPHRGFDRGRSPGAPATGPDSTTR
jgi:hypothetical protein